MHDDFPHVLFVLDTRMRLLCVCRHTSLVESTNAKIRVLTRMAYGFKSPDALIALALLAHGGYRPDLPGHQTAA
jgi:hypothetical protein